jgi:hypothetical protein
MHNLGTLLEETGRQQEAEQWYRQADTKHRASQVNSRLLNQRGSGQDSQRRSHLRGPRTQHRIQGVQL